MKLIKLICVFGSVLTAGCVSHREPVVYSPPSSTPVTVYTAPAPVPPTPTSPRPELRVYRPDASEFPGPAPVMSYASDEDLMVAQSIRKTFSADTDLMTGASNMRMTIQNGRVLVTGKAPSENARRLVERTLMDIPGVVAVDNRSEVDLH